MSKRSSLEVCGPNENGATARGASAVAFTNSRRLIVLMGTPPQTNLLRLLHHFLDAGSEIFQHHSCGVSSRPPGRRSARMRRRAGLIEAGDRHPMLRPTRHWTHRARLCWSRSARVTTAVPVVRVHPFQIERAFDRPRQNLVVGQIWRETPQVI